ncbi:MAG: hypothetical protein OXL96_03615 [Candidatus Poribacteria bacterium]|nr:hypothetical protein [Candidatus Poribacteria bacterium]
MKIVAMATVMAVLLNAMAPTLAHAATYLQGVEVNANTLVQDAYVQVIYYDRDDEQKLAKGWIDAVGETTFTIRSGALFGKKTITYDKVVSVIMSDESTAPVKQMNEVNRFIREMKAREIEQTKKEKEAKEEQIKREAEQAAMQQLKQRLKDKVVMIGQFDFSKKEWYAHVVYTSKEGYKRTATGQIIKQDTDHIVIRVQESGGLKIRQTIAYTDIDILVIAQHTRDIEEWRNARQTQQLLKGDSKVRVYAPVIRKGWMVGKLIKMTQDTLVVRGELTLYGRRFYQVPLSSVSNLEVSIGQYRNTFKGLGIGLGISGLLIAVAFMSGGGDYGMGLLLSLHAAIPITTVATTIGLLMKSDKWVVVPLQRLNLSVASTSSKGLRAALTFNF